MKLLLGFYVLALVIWFLGILIAFFHANKYKIPGDRTMWAFWIFLTIAAFGFFWSVSFVSSANWGL